MQHHVTVAKLRFPTSSEAFLAAMESNGAFFVDPDGRRSEDPVPEAGSVVSIAFVSPDAASANAADMNIEFSLRGLEAFYESGTSSETTLDVSVLKAMLDALVDPGSPSVRFG